MAAYSCPGGYDCASSNSCPATSIPCPRGWYCGLAALAPARPPATEDPAPGSAFLQAQCPLGYFCPSPTQMLQCPRGFWCPEGVASPLPCDALSVCATGAGFQVNFAAPLLALLYTAAVTGASWVLRGRQQRAAARCRELQARGSSSTTTTTTSAGAATAVHIAASAPAAPAAAVAPTGLGFALRSLSLLRGDKELLSGSLDVPAGRLVGVLGPSGCGKTLLLEVLRRCAAAGGGGAAAAPPGLRLAPGSAISALAPPGGAGGGGGGVGHVPQADVFDRAFTPRELLAHSAALRLPAGTPPSARAAAVAATLAELGLEGVADVVVGGVGGAPASVSGGQLKRVSIGMELVAAPHTLLLDEPTSGLDSTAALALLQCLQRVVAARGVTCVVALAQPRAEAYECLHSVVLLGARGRVAYAGSALGAVPWVARAAGGGGGEGRSAAAAAQQQALQLPPACNPADWLLDVLCGLAQGLQRDVDLPAQWAAEVAAGAALAPAPLAPAPAAGEPPAALAAPAAAAAAPPGLAAQFVLQLQRALLFRLRDAKGLLVFSLLHAFMALALSTGFSILLQKSYQRTLYGPLLPEFLQFVPPFLRPNAAAADIDDLGMQQLMFFISVSVGTASGMSSIGVFGGLAEEFRREVRGGASGVSLGAARMCSEVLLTGWVAAVFTGTWMLLGHAGHWWNWLGVVAGVSFAAAGLGHICSLLLPPLAAATLVQVLIIVTAVFSGVQPHLATVARIPVVGWVWYLSLGVFGGQGAYATWAEYQRSQRDVDAGAGKFGFDIGSPATSMGELLAIGVLWRAVALGVLLLSLREQRKRLQ